MMQRCYIIGVLSLLVLWPVTGQAQEAATLYLSADSLSGDRSLDLHDVPWRFHAGDSPAWADPGFDDSGWQLVRPDFPPDSLNAIGWTGIGWFRLHLVVDSTLQSAALVLLLHHIGASEVYLDGQLLHRFGTVGGYPEAERRYHANGNIPITLPLGDGKKYVLAVRYSFTEAKAMRARHGHVPHHAPGLEAWLLTPERLNDHVRLEEQKSTLQQGIAIGILLLMGFLFGLLFLLAGRDRVHLYFSLFTATIALNHLYPFMSDLFPYQVGGLLVWTGFLGVASISVALIFLLLAIYELFYPRLPRHFWVLLGLYLIGYGLMFTSWTPVPLVVSLVMVVPALEVLRVVGMALVRRKTDAWVVSLGVLGMAAGVGCGAIASSVAALSSFLWEALIFVLFWLSIPLAMAVLLTRRFTRTNQRLERELDRVEALSEQTLAQEREKKALIASQKERLEEEVAERTAQLRTKNEQLEAALTELKQTQQQLIHAEKMASLGALTAGIAHEIKNPLNFVNNFSGLSEELVDELREALQAGDTDEVDAILADLRLNAEKIREHGQRADGIVRSMMQHARGGPGEREAVDLNALVEEYVDLAYHGKRASTPDFTVEIERDLDKGVGTVEVVPQELGRVILNLVGNAFDVVREQWQSADDSYTPTVTVSTRHTDDQVEIRVEDNGPGIPDDIREKIFEPFFTTKPTGSGTGLGLSLSYDIVTQGHSGSLSVESEDGNGATFVVRLPVSVNS